MRSVSELTDSELVGLIVGNAVANQAERGHGHLGDPESGTERSRLAPLAGCWDRTGAALYGACRQGGTMSVKVYFIGGESAFYKSGAKFEVSLADPGSSYDVATADGTLLAVIPRGNVRNADILPDED